MNRIHVDLFVVGCRQLENAVLHVLHVPLHFLLL